MFPHFKKLYPLATDEFDIKNGTFQWLTILEQVGVQLKTKKTKGLIKMFTMALILNGQWGRFRTS